jgi:UPF0042 nucleotide-binding protein
MSRIVIVTGMAGAGRSSCLRILEDLGFEAVDNLPFQLLSRLLRPGELPERPLAVGIDSRTRGLVPEELVREIDAYRATGPASLSLVFFECSDRVLQQRFTETRRRHPLALDRPAMDGIALERPFLAPLKAAADLVYDTTETSLAELRRWVTSELGGAEAAQSFTLTILSFAFRRGLPREADLVFDMRFLDNPHYIDALRPLTGADPPVQEHIAADPEFAPTLERIEALLVPLLPRYRAEGKSYLTVAIGCTGGRHRSVFTAIELAARLRRAGWPATLLHRDCPEGGRRADGGME